MTLCKDTTMATHYHSAVTIKWEDMISTKHGIVELPWQGKIIEVRVSSNLNKREVMSITAIPEDNTWSVRVELDPINENFHLSAISCAPQDRHLCMKVLEHISTAVEDSRLITRDVSEGSRQR